MIHLKRGQALIDPIYDSDYFNPSSQLIKIPDSSKERCDQGIVYMLGEECDPNIKIGDHVIFSGYTGTTLGIDGRVFILMHSKFIKAVVDDSKPYIVPGLFLKGYNNEIFPCPYDTAVKLLREEANRIVASRIKVKLDSTKTQRDEIDSDNL